MESDMAGIRRQLAISCADALELMTDHLEGALSDADAARMRAHLDGCEPCRSTSTSSGRTIGIVHEAGPLEEFPVDRKRVDALIDLFRAPNARDELGARA